MLDHVFSVHAGHFLTFPVAANVRANKLWSALLHVVPGNNRCGYRKSETRIRRSTKDIAENPPFNSTT